MRLRLARRCKRLFALKPSASGFAEYGQLVRSLFELVRYERLVTGSAEEFAGRRF
jgi:hypothetical protein